ncbi:hypothetical protein [Actinomadura fibrosa]|uniref:Uncharacterized protein n=1 Tax=Actinomadura fibrosa TaxID=111802 RepID=A0ABW2XQT5_9ACTN|nr:hypothetical protein [Actinomadura fibrosa]
MSSTVEVYIADRRDAPAVAQRVAVALEVSGYFGTEDGYTLTLASSPWLDGPGVATLELSETDWDDDDPDLCTAYEPYDYELSIELRGVPGLARGEVRERLGRALFDRLTSLERPLAFGDNANIFADYRPGRGVREFPPGTSRSAPGRDEWFEAEFHGAGAAREPVPEPTPRVRGSATVFEVGGLLHLVARVPGETGDESTAVVPVAAIRRSAGPALVGRTLAEVLDRSADTDAVVAADPWPWVAGTAGLEPDAYAREAVSLDIEVAGESFVAVPRGVYSGSSAGVVQGPVAESLMVRESHPWDDRKMGDLVLRLLAAVRGHAFA